MKSAARDPRKPFCEGGTQTCEVCVGSCGIEEYEAESAAQGQQFDPLGEVWGDRGARWRCRIECKINWRGKTVYRWVLERKWMSWRDYEHGWWTQSEAKANQRGRGALLAHKQLDRYQEVGRV